MGIKDMLNPNSKVDDQVVYGDGTNAQSGNMSAATIAASSAMNSSSQTTSASATHPGANTPTTSENDRPSNSAASIASIKSGIVGNEPHSFNIPDSPLAQHDNLSSSANTGLKFTPIDHSHGGHGHEFRGDPCEHLPAEQRSPTGFHHTKGPHKVDTANILDPHVPGGFPADSTADDHQSTSTGTGTGTATTMPPHNSNVLNKLDPRVKQQDQSSVDQPSEHQHERRDAGIASAGPGAHETDKHHETASTSAVSQPYGTSGGLDDQRAEPVSTHHHGRDAAVVGGAGALGAGAYEADRHRGASGLGSSQPAGHTTGLDDQRAEFPHHSTHHGRDAALGGVGAGVLGTGAYEAEKHHGHSGTQPQAAYTDQSQGHHLGRDAAVGGAVGLGAFDFEKDKHSHQQPAHDLGSTTRPSETAQGAGYSSTAQSQGRAVGRDVDVGSGATAAQPSDHHYGRDVGIGAGAAGATGLAGYEYEKQRGQQPMASQGAPIAAGQQTTLPERQHPANLAQQQAVDPRSDDKDHHYGRDAALVGGAAAVTGTGAYEVDKHAQKKHEKELHEEIKQHEKEENKLEKQHDKEVHKIEKQQAKEEHKAEKHHEKEVAKIEKQHEKQHDKEVAKLEKQHEKEVAKLEKEHEKAEHAAEKDKKGGLFGFLHKNKSPDNDADDKHATQKHEAETAAGVSAAGVSADSLFGNDKKLHKDPPSHIKRQLEHQQGQTGSELQTEGYGRDASAVTADTDQMSGLEGTRAGAASGTGLTGLDSGDHISGSHQGGLTSNEPSGVSIDPVTGLPVNLAKYGSATGGTDGTSQIHDGFTRSTGQS